MSQILINNEPRKEEHEFLDQVLEHCCCDVLTGQFYCKKCKDVVYVDWDRNYAFCAVHGNLLSM